MKKLLKLIFNISSVSDKHKYILVNTNKNFTVGYSDTGYTEVEAFLTRKEVEEFLSNRIAKIDKKYWVLYKKLKTN